MKAFFAGTLSRSLLASALVTAPAVSTTVINAVAPEQSGWVMGSVQAQELIQPASEQPEPRRVPGISQRLNEELSEVQSLLEPEEGSGLEPDLDQALVVLQELVQDIDDFNPYEQAQIYNFLASVNFQLDQLGPTVEAFEEVVARSPQIPSGLERSTWEVLGKLHMQEENFGRSLEAFENWTNMVTDIGAEQYYTFSLLFYQMDQQERALAHANEAVRKSVAAGNTPKENWYSMQRLLYFEREDYVNTAAVLERMVRDYPKVSTWRQLSDIYSMLERGNDRLHSLELVYMLGGLDRENVLISLASMFLERDVPYKAAKILEKGIYDDEIIEPTSRNLELLANSWSLARETERSMEEMEKAAEKSDEGQLFARLAAIYMLNERYDDALEAGREALDRGVDRPDQVYLRMGTAHVNKGEYSDAVEVLEEAAKDKRSEAQAQQWIQYSEREQKREEQLAAERERLEEVEEEREEQDGMVLPGA